MFAETPSTHLSLPVEEIASLLEALEALQAEMLDCLAQAPVRLAGIHGDYIDSARNLLCYLVLRSHDLCSVQQRLASLGLSSLGRAEANILDTLSQVIAVLRCLSGVTGATLDPLDLFCGERQTSHHATALLGPQPYGRDVRIMVTLPREAAEDADWVRDLVAAGMDCARINCAYDDVACWQRMADHVRQAEAELEASCQIVVDLPGPKLRTGPIDTGPSVVRISPHRDRYGQVLQPAQVWLYAQGSEPPQVSAGTTALPLPVEALRSLQAGDVLVFRDARESKRRLEVISSTSEGCLAELCKTAYVTPGTVLYREEVNGRFVGVTVGPFSSSPQSLELREGELLILHGDLRAGQAALVDAEGEVLRPASVGCTLPRVFADVRTGESVWFDDGRIGGVIESHGGDHLQIRITRILGKARLQANKGINFPQSRLQLPALTAQDHQALAFAAARADTVELSFVNQVTDVQDLLHALAGLEAEQLGIVLKIETRQAFENLPSLLLAGMHSPRLGVMIARGDLAVESGFERLAELQEEILCLCEAAHVPVIWATQVLEQLAKKGQPSRAEITDAAMGVRAECVMLNKGPHILKAVHTLDDLLQRMRHHHHKKRDLLCQLQVAQLPTAVTEVAI